ncbi:MAG: SDR family oxidoreductase [Chloroflexota bacterium]|nr:SDR family oxidoreductase [Chloroflexota bacterium]
MEGQVVLVTGGTGGIGWATAKGVAEQGATVVIVGRNVQRGEEAAREIWAATGNSRVEYMQADLSNQADIERLAGEFGRHYDRLDVLVNNAGGIFWERRETEDALEMTFALNHLAYFYLTHLLLPWLVASAPARIVNVSSGAHHGARIHFDDLQQAQGYSPWRAYSQSKLANILFTRELARRLEGTGVTANALHPGFVTTGFGRAGGWIGRLIMPIVHLFAISPEAGAQTVIHLASAPEVEGVSGKYFENREEKRASRAAYDDEVARRLWERSLALTGIREPYGRVLEQLTG